MGLAVPDLRDDVIALRLPTERDVDAIQAACQDPEIPRFTRVPSPYTREDAEAFLTSNRTAWADTDAGRELSFLVVDQASDRLLGAIGLKQFRDRGACEVGYWLAAEARGQGNASRAVGLVARWALQDLNFTRLELMAHVDNAASQAVAVRAGFVREGVLRSYTVMGCCENADVVMFSLLPSDLI